VCTGCCNCCTNTATRNYFVITIVEAIAHYCNALLQHTRHTTATHTAHYCNALLQHTRHTTAMRYCNTHGTLLQCATATHTAHYCNALLLHTHWNLESFCTKELSFENNSATVLLFQNQNCMWVRVCPSILLWECAYAKLIVNFSHASNFTFLRTPF